MYIPSYFDESRLPVLQEFMQRHPFAAIVANTPTGLDASHVPLVLDATRGKFGTLRGHIARANPMWRETAGGTKVLAIFQGSSHYISPNWYPSKQEDGRVVPTWNYVVVHARGSIEWFKDPAWLRGLLEVLTTLHERAYPNPWSISDAPGDYLQRMLGAIVGFEIPIDEIRGQWKLSQNRSAADRVGVVSALAGHADASAQEMAALMNRASPEGD